MSQHNTYTCHIYHKLRYRTQQVWYTPLDGKNLSLILIFRSTSQHRSQVCVSSSCKNILSYTSKRPKIHLASFGTTNHFSGFENQKENQHCCQWSWARMQSGRLKVFVGKRTLTSFKCFVLCWGRDRLTPEPQPPFGIPFAFALSKKCPQLGTKSWFLTLPNSKLSLSLLF